MDQNQDDQRGLNRRKFMSAMALSAGAATVLGQVASPSGTAVAAEPAPAPAPAGAPPRPRFGDPVLGTPPPAGQRQQPQLTDLKGKTVYITAKFGNLHLLVNNAGIKTLRQASQVDPKSWDAAVAVNFTGIYNGCAAVIPHMIAHKEGSHIVTTSSMGGILPGVNAGVYTATKFASCGLMEALRVELMGTNIGTSVFLPGGVSTDNMLSDQGQAVLMMDPLEAG